MKQLVDILFFLKKGCYNVKKNGKGDNMKNITWKLLFLVNNMLLILYMCWYIGQGQVSIKSSIPLFISSIILIDITYISSCNVRESKIIWLFCSLLAFDSWYIFLSFRESPIENIVFIALSPIIGYISIKFILMFLFQGSGYRFQMVVNIILLAGGIGSLGGLCISNRMFACMYGIQFLSSIGCFLFIVGYHWRRAVFVLKSEWNYILLSVVITIIAFLVYYFATIEVKDHISNFGIYLPTLVFFISIHGIILKEHSSFPLSTVFNKVQITLIIGLSLIMFGLIILLMDAGYEELLILVNMLFVFIYSCNIVLGESLRQGKSKMMKESKYNAALRQLEQEEWLKTEFANFLHDDVLQDMLSIKNMMTKVHRPEVQDIIIETLDNLNMHIRQQIQDYHPVVLKNLTIKENYQNLIDSISQSFYDRTILVSFDCSDTLFLVEPYNILIYRLLKELLINVYKHSDGNHAWITLTQECGVIEFRVSDNGTADATCLTLADKRKHKGISSIIEQVNRMEGSIIISNNMPNGICVQISIPMKGEVSYQYFVS